MIFQKIKRTKFIEKIRTRLPESWRIRFGDIVRWWDFVFYRRFFKKKILGLVPSFRYIFLKPAPEEKRVLGIWNFAATPPTIGVFLEFEMRLLCMSRLNGDCKIDIVFTYDSSRSGTLGSQRYGSWMSHSNFHYHFGEMYPMVNILPQLGSVFLFDSHDKFERFYLDNQETYISHPTFFAYVNGSDSRPNIPFVRDYYLAKGRMPKFVFKPATINWARAFIKKHVGDNLMIAVSLRRNTQYTQSRDSNLKEWVTFFKYCLSNYNEIKFVVLGRRNEIRGYMEDLPNVIYSQIENTNIEQNLALIETSLMYMATVFGPASFPLLTDYIPFVITNYVNPEKLYDYKWLKKGGHFPWQNQEIQRLVWERETSDILIKEFEDVFSKIDKGGWRRGVDAAQADESKLEWPYN